MPETNGNETPVSRPVRKHNERTEAKFLEDDDSILNSGKTRFVMSSRLRKKKLLTNAEPENFGICQQFFDKLH